MPKGRKKADHTPNASEPIEQDSFELEVLDADINRCSLDSSTTDTICKELKENSCKHMTLRLSPKLNSGQGNRSGRLRQEV